MSEIKLPLTLIGTALIIYAGFGFATAGSAGVVITVFLLLLEALITTVLGIVACFGTAQILSTNFGTIKSASANLAAVALFPGAVGILMAQISPIVGVLTVIVLVVGLLKSLFDLEFFELVVFVLVLWGVSWAAEQVIGWF
ncbi:MAG: hypothetical protein P8K08_07215 [Fuerstiella sp.]|nr:hypothetical protein [Fuerstiella sp.]